MRTLLAVLAAVVFCSCAAQAQSVVERPDWERHFQAASAAGTLVLVKQGGPVQVHDPARAGVRYSPASTFKILNSLVALQTGACAGPETVFAWDGVRRDWPGWNQDLTLRQAFAVSSVPVYQGLARVVGKQRMDRYVRECAYGNMETGETVDNFWLDGSLRISALEQIDFLRRLHSGQLPFSQQTMDTVKELMALDKGEGWVIRAKTGWNPDVGWWVGWLESGGEVWFFALNIDMPTFEKAAARKEVVLAVLREQGALPPARGAGGK